MSFNIEAGGAFSSAILFVAHLGLCSVYIHGGLDKLTYFPGAVAEMKYFRLKPPALFAVLVIGLELVASAMVMTGFLRWLGALALAGFTLMSTLIALRFREQTVGETRHPAANAFFEHLGLAGGFLLVAWLDLVWATTLEL
ncbi:DoxX family protein [Brucella pituitosa]|uniref:DoxX family protein n=1 Tax=Brucella pituitosa TaxID=571256 RepID=UPI003C794E73